MIRKAYWFPAVLCERAIDDDDLMAAKSPTHACPKCEHYGGTNMDENGTFILCKYIEKTP